MNADSHICVIGAKGMLGHAVVNGLREKGYTNIIQVDKEEVDLRSQKETEDLLQETKPEGLFFLAAVAAGINYKKTHPVEMLIDNLQMVSNVFASAHKVEVKKLVNVCSALVYPRNARLPLKEEDIVSVDLDNVDTPYALAKGVGIKLGKYYSQEYSDDFVSAIPCNFFGEYAPFEGDRAGVVPSLIARFHEAKIEGCPQVEIWGSGNACRELLNSKDVASACIFLLENEVKYDCINIGRGEEFTIREVAETIKRVVGYEGELLFNTEKPEGRLHMQLDVNRISKLGWKPAMNLEESIKDAYNWYVRH